jgi:hypothetical protein
VTIDTFVKAQLALLCWRNAPAGKPFTSMKALAFLVRNRVKAGWMGGDWLAVIAEDPAYAAHVPNGQYYSSMAPHTRLDSFPDLRNDLFQRFLWEVDRVYDGTAGDTMTEGALWWAELDKIDRPWFLEHIARRPEDHPRVAQVVTLTLWR